LAALALTAWALGGCSVGVGEGSLEATVWAPECGLEGEQKSINPTFFAADPVEEVLEIRVQKGSDFEDVSDGVAISVLDVEQLKQNHLGEPIELGTGPDSLATLSFYLNETCDVRFDRPPVNYVAHSGTITFSAIYAPQVAEDEVQIEGSFSGVEVHDGADPDERHAVVEGEFDFLFNRGRPVQRFP
jgi:hypothetical protein